MPLVTKLWEEFRVEEVTLALSIGGRSERPTWRLSVDRFSMDEEKKQVIGEWIGGAPLLQESKADEIVAVAIRAIWSLLRDELRLVCDEHLLIGCTDCFGERRSEELWP